MKSAKKIFLKVFFWGVIGAAIFLAASMFMARQWLIVGKIEVVPNSPSYSSENLSSEVGNVIQIIESAQFRQDIFQNVANNFQSAQFADQSSTVVVRFLSQEKDISQIENVISYMPEEISVRSRGVYDSSPFKYKLIGKPELSRDPVRPNLLENALLGFFAGSLLYIIFFLLFRNRQKKKAERQA